MRKKSPMLMLAILLTVGVARHAMAGGGAAAAAALNANDRNGERSSLVVQSFGATGIDLLELMMLALVLSGSFFIFRFWKKARHILMANQAKIDGLIAHPGRIREGTLYTLNTGVSVLSVTAKDQTQVILAHGQKADALYKTLVGRGVSLRKHPDPVKMYAIIKGDLR